MEKFQADKLEPKADKCIFIEYPKQLGIPPISDLEAKVIVSRNGSFLEEKFLSKELSGRMVEIVQLPDTVGMLWLYQTSQRNWVTIKVHYRYLRKCLLG